MSAYTPELRQQLREACMKAGITAARADQAVDLACHAADRANDAFSEAIRLAPDGGVGLMALEMGAQLAAARLNGLFQRVHDLGKRDNLPTVETALSVPV
jgi:hypothetical protein